MLTLIVAASLGQCHAPAVAYGHATYAAPAYHAPAYHAVNFVGFVAVDPYHSTVGAAARVESKAAADAKATADLTAQIATLNATIAGLAGAQVVTPSLTETLGPPPGADGPPQGPQKAAPTAYASTIIAKCASCHNPAKQSGGLAIVGANGDLLNLDADTKFAMLDSVADKRMPRNKEAGSPEARRALADWLKADSDAILAALKDNGK